MKIKVFLNLIVIIGILISCKKPENLPPDYIIYSEINKTITLLYPDSISGTCKYLIFEIIESNSFEETSLMKLNGEPVLCDGFDNILANSDNEKVTPLNENQKINEIGNWVGINEISLEEFAGKGEKYIGYRSGIFPSGITNYNYGWIRLELSSDQKTLRIIDRATNYTENKYIRTGQVE
jgi:hypothetical protein